MTSTMIPLPKTGTAFAGATPVRRPGESGTVADEQSFANRFDRALTDVRSSKDRPDSSGDAGKSKPSHDHDRVGEARLDSTRLDKNDSAHLHNTEEAPDLTSQESSDIGVGLSDPTDVRGDASNEVAGSVAVALGLKGHPETVEARAFSVLVDGPEVDAENPDITVPSVRSAQPEAAPIDSRDGASPAGLADQLADELGEASSLQDRTAQRVSDPARSDLLPETQPAVGRTDGDARPSTATTQEHLDALNLDSEMQVSLAASSNDDDPESEDLAIPSEGDAPLEVLTTDSDDVVTARSPAGERSATGHGAQPLTASIVAASAAPLASASTSSLASSTGTEPQVVGTGPIEVATNTNSAAPIELGPNVVAVGASSPSLGAASTSPPPVSQQQATMEAAILRIADTAEALSKQPPPRAISLDFGEAHGIRVRIAIDAGGISVTVADAGAGTSDTATWQRQLNESFDQEQRNRESQQPPTDDDAGYTARFSARQIRQDAGLRL
ncbi:MAG: hypothetical protein GXP35_08555 [Actinobacteria bacterium]|nr:hypothetical protein [Actinomycetota bacterium]